MIPLLLGAVGAVAFSVLNRRRIARTVDAEYATLHATGPNGIADGAEGYTLPSASGRGLLLLHGSGDSPQSMRYLAAALNAVGYEVHAPLLPGHGRSPSAFAVTTAADYHAAVFRELRTVAERNVWTGVIGLSMGAALATSAASESTAVEALVLLAPYMIPPRAIRATARMAPLWSALVPFVRGRGADSIHDAVAGKQSRAYGTFSRGALTALVTAADAGFQALPRIRVPTLVINSTEDNRIPRELAERVLGVITAPVEQHWLDGCGHVITVDFCKDEVVTLVIAFLARHAG